MGPRMDRPVTHSIGRSGRTVSAAVVVAALVVPTSALLGQSASDGEGPDAHEGHGQVDGSTVDPATKSPAESPNDPRRAEADEPPSRTRASAGLELWRRDLMTGDWWGARPTLEEDGVDLQLSFIYDIVGNLSGGIRTGNDEPYLFNAQLELDLELLLGLEGAEFLALGQIAGGGNPSVEFVGDYQGVDNNAFVGSLGQLSQIWYRQRMLENRFSVQLGKLDFLASFASPSTSATFINNGLDYPATLNVSSPTFPNQAFGILLEGRPIENLELKFGVYDGSNPPAIGAPPGGTGGLGPATFFDNTAGYFIIGETRLSWSRSTLPGSLAAGGWGHTGEFPSLAGGVADGTGGGYAYLEQTVWLADDGDPEGPGVSLFGIASAGDAATNPARWSLSGGVSWKGPIPSRPNDEFGLGVAYVRFSEDGSLFPSPAECAIEAFYSLQLTPWLSIQPDLQYVIDPGGNALADENALVGILRFTLAF